MEQVWLVRKRAGAALAIVVAALLLAACGNEDVEEEEETVDSGSLPEPVGPAASAPPPGASPPSSTPPPYSTPPPPPSASAPQISGTPKTQALVNQAYLFMPTAHDADGDPLQFTIANRPPWLTFNSSTGRLNGTPTAGDVGLYRGITIQVSDGATPKTLPQFDIEVLAVGTSSVTLRWIPPTENEDGTPLTNLSGYKIRYGESSGSYTNTISLNNPGLATYVVEGLLPTTYYFVLTSVNAKGIESDYSNEAVISL